MSSRGPKSGSSSSKGSGGGGFQYPTGWSEWVWNAEYNCKIRYRLRAPDDYQYEYGPVQAPEVPRTPTDMSDPIPEEPYSSQDNYTTTDPVNSITSSLANVSMLPSTIQQPHVSQAYTTPATSWIQGRITTRNPKTSTEKFDPSYRVHGGHEFQWGKVFKVLWAEPKGNNGNNAGDSEYSYSERNGKFGEKFYEKVRRFVIIDRREGHCICLPIMTYSGQGINKGGVHAGDHTVIWTENAPAQFAGEAERGLTKTPIRVQPSNKRHKLDPASRLNYAKLYTVEYNVKVWFIGKIHRSSENVLIADYNLVHPPMQLRTVAPSSADTYAYAGGATSTYQAPYSTYDAPALYSTSAGTEVASSSTPTSYSGYPVSTTSYSGAETASSYPATTDEDPIDPSQASSYRATADEVPSDPSQASENPPSTQPKYRY